MTFQKTGARPLIFLAKIRRIDLWREVTGGRIHVPASVREEALPPSTDPAEADYLLEFLGTCTVETVRQPRRFAWAMSQADNDALTLAVRLRAALLLCDDRIVRLAAQAEGIRPVGTLGILMRARRRGAIAAGEAKDLLDRLVRFHQFRIGIELYQAVVAEIGA